MTNVEGAKFPLVLTDEEWARVLMLLNSARSSLDFDTVVKAADIHNKLRDQLEKMGVKA